MKTKFLTAGLMFAGLLVAGPAAAQPSTNAAPNFGTLNLRGGFQPDPTVVPLRAGGDMDASSIGGSCSGFITRAPDVRLNYTPGSLPLIISVASGADTTLVVNGPDGRYYCDDDSGERGLNPMVRFGRPAAGRYEIWVGTLSSGSTEAANLHVSELRSQ